MSLKLFYLEIQRDVNAHLSNLNNVGPNIAIPQHRSLVPATPFLDRNINPRGLLNDGATCGLISLVTNLHRMGIVRLFVPMDQIRTNNGRNADYPILVLRQILLALPSPQPFSLQLFVNSWNQSAQTDPQRAPIVGNDDLLMIDSIFTALKPMLQVTNPPILTTFTVKYTCNSNVCNNNTYRDLDLTNVALFKTVPMITLPSHGRYVNVGQLLTNFLAEHHNMVCLMCGTMCDATIEAKKGKYTLLVLDRRGLQAHGLNQKQLVDQRRNSPGDNLLGELVACICHRGDAAGGHWVAYSRSGHGVWWLNNDDHRAAQSPNHPFQSRVQGETVDFLCYIN